MDEYRPMLRAVRPRELVRLRDISERGGRGNRFDSMVHSVVKWTMTI